MPIRRTLKNVVNNFTDPQVKVREATSNDPWGPSSTIMGEIADLTYNVVAFTEIMQMIWKRLNDHGKNWRHVYKSLVLLDYIVKTGSDKVAQQCKENIYAIQTLKDFQYMEENKDQGMNVREKAKQLVLLLKDDERLKNERAKALKAKERFAQNSMGIGSDSQVNFGRAPTKKESPRFRSGSDDRGASSRSTSFDSSPSHAEAEAAKPNSMGEEELQLQLALAMSKEEYAQEQKRKQKDDIKLHLAMEESKKEMEHDKARKRHHKHPNNSNPGLLDLVEDTHVQSAPSLDPWGTPLTTSPAQPVDPWGAPARPPDPWASPSGPQPPLASDPWDSPSTGSAQSTPQRTATKAQPAAQSDPWALPVNNAAPSSPWNPQRTMTSSASMPVGMFANPTNGATNNIDDAFDALMSRPPAQPTGATSLDPLGDMASLDSSLPQQKKTPEDFLGANKNLVNLDSLVAKPAAASTNPFATSLSGVTNNPFGNNQPQRVPMNQMQPSGFVQPQQYYGAVMPPQPMMPMQAQNNPFL